MNASMTPLQSMLVLRELVQWASLQQCQTDIIRRANADHHFVVVRGIFHLYLLRSINESPFMLCLTQKAQ